MKFTFPPESRPLAGFTIKRAIYRGGFGEVYYGLSDAGREVALKLLQNNTEVELRGVQQCLNLSHPNLVTIFDVRQDGDGDHWIVMEYVSGETLDAAIRRHPEGMPIETVRKWLPGLAAGVAFLHSRGIVHRDLKPANIFIESQVVKIGDVGLSKFIAPSRRSAQTQSVGTVYYMAPEVAQGRYGKEVDIYATGIILYEMLTGQVPFDGESTGEILMKHLTQPPDLTRLPPRLQGVIGQALHKDPARRQRTLDELLRAFDAAVLGKAEANSESSPPAAFESTSAAAESTVGPADPLHRIPHEWRKPLSWACGVGGVLYAFYGMDQWSALALFLAPVMLYAGYVLHPRTAARRRLGGNDKWRSPADRPARHIIAGLVLIAIFLLLAIKEVRSAGRPPALAALAAGMGLVIVARSLTAARSPQRPVPPSAPAAATVPKPPSRWAHSARPIGNACGAAALAVPFAALFTGIIAVLKPSLFIVSASKQLDPGLMGFFASVAIVGCWAVAALPLFAGPAAARHWVSPRWDGAILGALVGLAATGIDHYLLIDLPTPLDHKVSTIHNRIGEYPLVLPNSGPTALCYVLFFAALFWMRDWRQLTSLSRWQRFQMGAVIKTACLGWMITWFLPFPVPWALAWSTVLACAVQLASPWEGKMERVSRRHAGTAV